MKYKTCCLCGRSAGKHATMRRGKAYCHKCVAKTTYRKPDEP